MSRNKSVKQRLDGEQHYDELESDIDEKASERFHTPPAYQSYEVTDFLKKSDIVDGRIKAAAERDVYKELYMYLLDRAISA